VGFSAITGLIGSQRPPSLLKVGHLVGTFAEVSESPLDLLHAQDDRRVDDEPRPEIPPEIPRETLGFIFDHIKGAPAEHHEIWTSLDNKVVSVFGVGSAVVGLAGFTVTKESTTSSAVAIILGLALLAYGLAAGAALHHLWPKEARQATYGDTLWPDAWDRSVLAIKHGLVTDITEASRQNKEVLKTKAVTLRLVVASVGIETILVGMAFVVHLLGD
jgi:hypothetical protein